LRSLDLRAMDQTRNLNDPRSSWYGAGVASQTFLLNHHPLKRGKKGRQSVRSSPILSAWRKSGERTPKGVLNSITKKHWKKISALSKRGGKEGEKERSARRRLTKKDSSKSIVAHRVEVAEGKEG